MPSMSVATSAILASAVVLAPPSITAQPPSDIRLGAAEAASLQTPVQAPSSATGARQAAYAEAAHAFGVPESVLLGVSYMQSRWDVNAGEPSTSGGYGPMHLIDLKTARLTIGAGTGNHHDDNEEDPRGDDTRPLPPRHHEAPGDAPPEPRTLMRASELTGITPERLRSDPAANIRGGAALLSETQRALGKPADDDPSDWYDAVARYSGEPTGGTAFADEVFAMIRSGMTRTTDDGHPLRLGAHPALTAPAASRGSRPSADSGPRASADRGPRASSSPPRPRRTAGDSDRGQRRTAKADRKRAKRAHAGARAGRGRTPKWRNTQRFDEGRPARVSMRDTPSRSAPRGSAPGVRDGGARDGGASRKRTDMRAECPESLACEWMPAAYKRLKKGGYGNHDRMAQRRPIDYIVIHDTEGSYRGVPSMVSNPSYVSWHYTIRSEDGHVAQHVRTNDIAWHAGNWDINSRSIGIEHEGYLAHGGTWYTEAMYRSSAKLVKYLAEEHDIPLDRAHILGHDNIPGITPEHVRGMHVDPGPYWDWARFFDLLDSPITGSGPEEGESVVIRPDFDRHRVKYTGCTRKEPGKRCKSQGSASVWLHTQPSHDAPLVQDIGKHAGGKSTHSVYDHAARASTGQRYAKADRQGDWTAIWYLNQKAWFYNPENAPTALPAGGPLVTPRAGLRTVRLYGRAYPEADAYPRGIEPIKLVPLQYTLRAGQRYALGHTLRSIYTHAKSFNPRDHIIIRGKLLYHQIQFGHRVMFVKADDVEILQD
ncbi:N-acetylmuramoyl-L-alanine amidase [Sinosporangium album]|uniref:N-acetylmuramoyl-L-alanine amidase n=1 Tax=Sinosporangium album TaxID=504805 RepID=A0A1G8I9Z7_9ACTN|nr:N-acetylmuramoyl-L-alanine amidase [Sinosporangium album]SDI15390.1 N-acetylmuramoyl-L-alanine amidase [Sinosporangium album]